MENIVKDIEKEKRLENSTRLNQWTTNLFNKQKEIKRESNEKYNELHLKFHNKHSDLNIDEINLVKDVFDFLKEQSNEE